MIGQTLAHYGFEGLLGEGGSGVVYRGRDLRLERPVAIKVLADALRDDELAWGRLLREARLASQLNHPHISAIYDLGEEDGRAYIVMELVEGLPLAELIPEGGMPREQVERYAKQICDALAYAHEHGTLHGDLKGANIMITPEGNIKLLDFGLGRRVPHNGALEVSKSSLPLAQIGVTAGTLPYLAPEVLRGGPTSVQSDIWALAVLLYQMLTGDLPFSRGHILRTQRGDHDEHPIQAMAVARAPAIHAGPRAGERSRRPLSERARILGCPPGIGNCD